MAKANLEEKKNVQKIVKERLDVLRNLLVEGRNSLKIKIKAALTKQLSCGISLTNVENELETVEEKLTDKLKYEIRDQKLMHEMQVEKVKMSYQEEIDKIRSEANAKVEEIQKKREMTLKTMGAEQDNLFETVAATKMPEELERRNKLRLLKTQIKAEQIKIDETTETQYEIIDEYKSYLVHYINNTESEINSSIWMEGDLEKVKKQLSSIPNVMEAINLLQSAEGIKILFNRIAPDNPEAAKLIQEIDSKTNTETITLESVLQNLRVDDIPKERMLPAPEDNEDDEDDYDDYEDEDEEEEDDESEAAD